LAWQQTLAGHSPLTPLHAAAGEGRCIERQRSDGATVARYKTTRLQRNVFDIRIIERLDPRGNAYFWIGSDFKNSQQPDTDVYALNNGFVSVTPLTLDNTAATDKRSLEEWLKGFDDGPR